MHNPIIGILFIVWVTLSVPVLAAPDFMAIKQSAVFANAAYGNQAQIQTLLSQAKLPLIKAAVLPGSEVSYFLTQLNKKNRNQTNSLNSQATEGPIHIISVRGTANLNNVIVNLDLNLVQDSALNIKVHQGFATAAKAVYADVKPYLNKQMPIQTTGHSLGGAVAVLLTMYLQKDGYNIQPFITFGQPKVSNVTGTRRFANLPLTRVVTADDIVPLVPPLSPLQLKDLDIYWHSGEEIILLEGNQYSITSGLKSMVRATKFTSALPSEANLNAHKMSRYVQLINSKLKTSVEVPYKTGIKVFGLSFD